LAWDAFRMAEEARLAAEKLAEVKLSVSLRSQRSVALLNEDLVVEARKAEEQTKPAGAALEPVEESTKVTPNVKATPAQTDAAKRAAIDPTVEASWSELVVQPAGIPKVETPVNRPVMITVKAVPAPQAAPPVLQPETDLFVRMLDAIGVDKFCGVEEMMQDAALTDERMIETIKQRAAAIAKEASKAVELVVTPITEVMQPAATAMTDAEQLAAPATTVVAQTDETATSESAQNNDAPAMTRAAPVDPPSTNNETGQKHTTVLATTDIAVNTATLAQTDDAAQTAEVAAAEASTSPRHKSPRELTYPDPFGGDHDDFGSCCGTWV
jgi:hypothetical protein